MVGRKNRWGRKSRANRVHVSSTRYIATNPLPASFKLLGIYRDGLDIYIYIYIVESDRSPLQASNRCSQTRIPGNRVGSSRSPGDVDFSAGLCTRFDVHSCVHKRVSAFDRLRLSRRWPRINQGSRSSNNCRGFVWERRIYAGGILSLNT